LRLGERSLKKVETMKRILFVLFFISNAVFAQDVETEIGKLQSETMKACSGLEWHVESWEISRMLIDSITGEIKYKMIGIRRDALNYEKNALIKRLVFGLCIGTLDGVKKYFQLKPNLIDRVLIKGKNKKVQAKFMFDHKQGSVLSSFSLQKGEEKILIELIPNENVITYNSSDKIVVRIDEGRDIFMCKGIKFKSYSQIIKYLKKRIKKICE